MGILPVVNLEQVIAQSPALMGERVREQKKEEGPSASGEPPGVREEEVPPPATGITPVHRIGQRESPEEGLEKEKKSEYSPGNKEKRREHPPTLSGEVEPRPGKQEEHRLDIEA